MPVDIRKPLKKLLPHLIKGKEDNLNEADTVQRIIKMFEEVLGFDTVPIAPDLPLGCRWMFAACRPWSGRRLVS